MGLRSTASGEAPAQYNTKAGIPDHHHHHRCGRRAADGAKSPPPPQPLQPPSHPHHHRGRQAMGTFQRRRPSTGAARN
ncbi:unnamed protein product [Urochloa humidicola]